MIIPELGGFVSEYRPARIHPGNHVFLPPSRALAFNPLLQRNDGLITDALGNRVRELGEACDFEKADRLLRQFVQWSKKELQEHKALHLPGVGKLLEQGSSLRFVAEERDNFHADSFGLPSFQALPISRSEPLQLSPEREEAEPIKIELEGKRETRPLPWFAAVAASVMIFMAAAYWLAPGSFMDPAAWFPVSDPVQIDEAQAYQPEALIPDIREQMAGFGPTSPFSSMGPAARIGDEVESNDSGLENSVDSSAEENPEEADERTNPEVDESADNSAESSTLGAVLPNPIYFSADPQLEPFKGYYIVIGSYVSRSLAERRLERDVDPALHRAVLLSQQGNYRAAIFVSDEKQVVLEQLSDLRALYDQPDAWVLRQR